MADICRRAGISQAACFKWKKNDGPRLTQLEDENGKPRKLVSNQSLDKETLQDVARRKL